MAESLTLLTCVDEGLRRGVQRGQEDAMTSRRHTNTYETFQGEDAGSGDRRDEREEETTVGCSPGVFLRRLGWMVTGRENDEESLLLTERRKLSTPICRRQVFRVRGVEAFDVSVLQRRSFLCPLSCELPRAFGVLGGGLDDCIRVVEVFAVSLLESFSCVPLLVAEVLTVSPFCGSW